MENQPQCSHTTLHFGSGGYYIFCSAPTCGKAWVAIKMGNDGDLDPERGSECLAGSLKRTEE